MAIFIQKHGRASFWCPGCDDLHQVDSTWQISGTEEAPTISPSVLVEYGNHAGAKRCHSFVREGRIEFLSDCTHDSTGKTLPLADLPDWVIAEGID
jgi:Family of unknown function (DUF6527)